MKVLVSALESSSNLHLKELLKHLNNVNLFGIFDSALGNPTYDVSHLASMGLVDTLKKIIFFLRLKKEMAKLAKDADKILLLDSSAFNLPLAKAIKKLYPNKEIIYYILPQVWVSRKNRIQKIQKYCDKLCSIIPFEKQLYTIQDKITYVGHPLLDEINITKDKLSNNNIIAFMPGSRKSEISKLMPIYKKLSTCLPGNKILVIPHHFNQEFIKETYGDISGFQISNNTHKTLLEADFGFICSGTATLEAALIGTPFVLCYITTPIDYVVFNMLIKINYVGLANIFFEKLNKKPLHAEILQENVTVKNLLKEYNNLDRNNFIKQIKFLRSYLGHGSSKTVANIIQN